MKELNTIICGPQIYGYEGWTFELHAWCGPWPLRKDGHPKWITHAEFRDGRRIKCDRVSLDTHNTTTYRCGRAAAGHHLDGREHLAYPDVTK